MRFLSLRSLAVVAVALGLAALFVGWQWWRPLDLPAERVEVRIERGAGARTVALRLQQAGVELPVSLFVTAATLTGADRGLRAGRYEITAGTSLRDLLGKLRRGEVVPEKLVIVEGMNFRDLRALLAAQPLLKQDAAALSDAQLLAAIGATESHPEGLFAPDTYYFEDGMSDLALYRAAYRAQAQRLTEAWAARDPALPLTGPYQALILASIIEKETGRPEERARIAGVFVNRLRRGMALQTDPTVIYGLGAGFDGNLRRRDLQTDGPYNSYTRPGLPPTPIAAPGKDALQAAVRPEATRALYFVARGDGSSEFSETLAEHNRAVNRYQRGGRP